MRENDTFIVVNKKYKNTVIKNTAKKRAWRMLILIVGAVLLYLYWTSPSP